MIVTLYRTIGFDKLIHVLKAENVFYSFIFIHENQHFRYFEYSVYGFYLTSLKYQNPHRGDQIVLSPSLFFLTAAKIVGALGCFGGR
jgi:hypothetical protein